ncbi:TolC family protein [Porticoccus sp. W117]|uniref:TolC family protein n=1 Tax=Porticoccus sp. W117 TaxID=3054777 RepID=UPI00259A0C06|nr:TolC family protein [Porticoccus sp. W117]MDM3869870.1 TolC family protein [Porticoccus sp. W117]
MTLFNHTRLGPLWLLAALLLMKLLFAQTAAANSYRIAVISDGPDRQLSFIEQQYRQELVALTEGEFAITFKPFRADWSAASIQSAFDRAYSDPEVDMLLVSGLAANQIGAARKQFPKPTFLPLVFDAQLLGVQATGRGSGVSNLNYLVDRVEFTEQLASFQRVAPVKNIALLVDEAILAAVPSLAAKARQLAAQRGITMHFIGHDGVDHKLLQQLPQGVDGLMMAGLPRMPKVAMGELLENINQRQLPSFSLLGSDGVRLGMLVSDSPATDWQRIARRNALNMQAVMLGEKAGDQPTLFQGKRELTINMATARQIGISPRFDVLSEAVLLNQEQSDGGPLYDLTTVAQLAVARNLQLSAEAYGVAAGERDIASARANLLPQLSLGAANTRRKVSPLVSAGQQAQRSRDGSLTLSQLLYSDDAWSNFQIQGHLQNSREAGFEQLRLDIIQAATVAYLNVLRAREQLRIQQDNLSLTRNNLSLARDRVAAGSSSAADQYRWESQLATDRSELLRAQAGLRQAQENLNRLLHRPITEPFQLAGAQINEPFVMTEAEFNELIDNPRNLGFLTDFSVQRAIELSPQLRQLQAQLAANKREVVNRKRDFWLPDFSISSQYGKNFDQAGVGAGPGESLDDWSVSINASLPLFQGGGRKSALSKTKLEGQQLRTLINATREQIEQQVRAEVHSTSASYSSIELSRQAAEAADKNLDLVGDSYAKGVVSVIELLDAQNAALQAQGAAANAVYDFLINVMNLQRAAGEFEFLLPPDKRGLLAEQLREYIGSRQ